MTTGTILTKLHFLCSLPIAQLAGMLNYFRLERLGRYKHINLLGPFMSHEEIKVLWIELHIGVTIYIIYMLTRLQNNYFALQASKAVSWRSRLNTLTYFVQMEVMKKWSVVNMRPTLLYLNQIFAPVIKPTG